MNKDRFLSKIVLMSECNISPGIHLASSVRRDHIVIIVIISRSI